MPDISWLASDNVEFPPTHTALNDPNGLLAAGGDLSPERLLAAYKRGIFPWFSDDQPILWWSPNPRTVFFPKDIHISKSMAKFIRKCDWQVRLDSDFEQVVEACSASRDGQDGTWICEDMKTAYAELHNLGFAHSIEVFQGDALIGGLYGIGLGRTFFGESMFSNCSNASKYGFILFSRWALKSGFTLIDGQVENPHLSSLGAVTISREKFEQALDLNTTPALIDSMQTSWAQANHKTIARDGHIYS